MDAATISKIVDISQTGVVQIDGQPYATKPVFSPPLPHEPLVGTIEVSTLTGFVDFCKTQADELGVAEDIGAPLIHVKSPSQVYLVSQPVGVGLKRHVHCSALHEEDGFPFEEFLTHTDFMIKAQVFFADREQRADVLKVIGTVKDSNIKTSMDNGVAQTVQAVAGVALREDVNVPNPVRLAPYRTFREIEQPSSLFVLRLQQGRELPMMALFEAEGNRWEVDAIQSIRAFLVAAGLTIPIIA